MKIFLKYKDGRSQVTWFDRLVYELVNFDVVEILIYKDNQLWKTFILDVEE